MKQRTALYTAAALFVLFLLSVKAAYCGHSQQILGSLFEISSTIQKEYYTDISESALFTGALREAACAGYKAEKSTVASRQEFAAEFSRLAERYPSKLPQIGELSVKGMIKSLNDPYSLFLNTEQWIYFRKVSQGGEVTGIGVELAKKNGQFVIVAPVEGGSAQKAGVMAGDAVIAVSGKNISGMDDVDVLNLFDGPAGSILHLKIKRGSKIHSFQVKRSALSLKAPKGSILKGKSLTGYLRISYFSEKTHSEAKELLDKMKNSGCKNIIIDLRNNPGGDFKASVKLASMFTGRGTIVNVVKNGGAKERIKGEYDPKWNFNTVILINQGSASASEVFSSCLQDSKKARLIGKTSFGKALIQSVYSLPGNAGCKITTAKYYTAAGRDILGKGLTPDIKVSAPDMHVQISDDPYIKQALKAFQ